MSASYEFGREIDAALARPIHRQTHFQTPVLSHYASKPPPRIDAQGHPTQRVPQDYANMFARYQRVRAALDRNSASAFLEANGYDTAVAAAILKFDGIDAGIGHLAADCPRSESYESFASDGGFGSLLIHHGGSETAVYFIRRGEDWVLQQCGHG